MDKTEATRASFGSKWQNNPDLLFDQRAMVDSGLLAWIVERNGFPSMEDFSNWVSQHGRILDAGCGNGRITRLLSMFANDSARVVGIDVNPEVARRNLADDKDVEVLGMDLTQDLSALGQFDLIYCQEVLHHTHSPQLAFSNLCSLLTDGGEIAIYVYKQKAMIREFADDAVRHLVEEEPYEVAIDHMRSITELGRALSDMNIEVEVPDVPILGIKAGSYSLQRFIYHYFLKCFWNPNLSFSDNIAINYDWYHPSIATRHTMEEVIGWFATQKLKVVSAVEDDYGITVRGLAGN